eukprot:CAMPEP_0176452096 /NCGR_PEP_ID=MMETSP0127-20121128/28301_1 /TAXON_ID=938130 /ORGANISM="Platyophrya macrostoma, Strain WH" /LENGTH=483 /DNA_ID=CAMNT_0017840423 /DNA_START=20 /DNA_END=1471 /DNA_ORIENTATION=+
MGFGKVDYNRSSDNAYAEAAKASMVGGGQRSFMTTKQPSHITIFNIANTMVGTAMLVTPLQFLQAGIIPSLIAILIVGWVNFKTCNLCIIHKLNYEGDLSEILERIMGVRWKQAFLLSSIALMFVLGVAYFLLMLDPFYTILKGFSPSLPEPKHFTFAEFSYQWAAIILIVICFALFSAPNLSLILKLNSLGILALIVFLLFIFVTGFEAIFRGKVYFVTTDDGASGFPLVSKDIITICGIFALAFAIHNAIVQIIRYNKDAKKNTRDLGLGYLLGSLIYAGVGIFGGFAVSWRPKCSAAEFKNHDSSTLMDCFTSDEPFSYYFMLVAAFFVLLHLATVIPIIIFVVRNQALELFFGTGRPPAWAFWGFNTLQTSFMLLAALLNVFPSTLLAIDGAVCGFGLLYVVPIFLHFRACFGVHEEDRESGSHSSLRNPSLNKSEAHSEDNLAIDYKNQESWKTYGLYGSIFVFGFALMVFQLYQTFA